MKRHSLLAVFLVCISTVTNADTFRVATSIHPLTLLARDVFGDSVQIQQVVPDGVSPHHYALKPSDLTKLSDADLVFWLGPEGEPYLKKTIAKLKHTRKVAWMQIPGINTLHASHDHHHEGDWDIHVWLSPSNAQQAISALTEAVQDRLPAQVERSNALQDRLRSATTNCQARLEKVSGSPYLVYHDAYRYWERDFHLHHTGQITLSSETDPGVKHLLGLQKLVREKHIACVVVQPGWNQGWLQKIYGEMSYTPVTIDPLGLDKSAPTSGYVNWVKSMCQRWLDCLK